MAITTTSTLPSPVQQSFSYKLLSVPVPNMIHKIPATKKVMPRNGGNTLRMRRYNALSTAMVPLGNSGVTPPAQTLTAVDIDAKIQFYGTYLQLNEQVTLQNQDPVLNEVKEVFVLPPGIQIVIDGEIVHFEPDGEVGAVGLDHAGHTDPPPVTKRLP